MSESILLVEDDDKIAEFVVKGLQGAGFGVERAPNGEDGLKLASENGYSAAIIDLMLPGMDGLTLIEKLRDKNVNTPFLILSAKRTVDDRIKGLQAGGDDYMVKPFAMSELQARIQALIRRAKRSSEPTRLSAGDVTVDLISREAFRNGKQIQLQSKEFSLLEYLMRNAGKVVSKTMILEHIWHYNFDPQTNVVDVLVCRLRNKIDKDADGSKRIQTLRGVGYVFKTD